MFGKRRRYCQKHYKNFRKQIEYSDEDMTDEEYKKWQQDQKKEGERRKEWIHVVDNPKWANAGIRLKFYAFFKDPRQYINSSFMIKELERAHKKNKDLPLEDWNKISHSIQLKWSIKARAARLGTMTEEEHHYISYIQYNLYTDSKRDWIVLKEELKLFRAKKSPYRKRFRMEFPKK